MFVIMLDCSNKNTIPTIPDYRQKMGCGFRFLHLGNIGDDLDFLHVHKQKIVFPLQGDKFANCTNNHPNKKTSKIPRNSHCPHIDLLVGGFKPLERNHSKKGNVTKFESGWFFPKVLPKPTNIKYTITTK